MKITALTVLVAVDGNCHSVNLTEDERFAILELLSKNQSEVIQLSKPQKEISIEHNEFTKVDLEATHP